MRKPRVNLLEIKEKLQDQEYMKQGIEKSKKNNTFKSQSLCRMLESLTHKTLH